MYFLFSTILISSLNSQNLNPSQWTTTRHLKRTARSKNSSDQNITSESWMDGLSDDEIMFYQNFALSSKIYPDKLDLLLKAGFLLKSQRKQGLKTLLMESILSQYFQTITNWYQDLWEKINPIFILILIYFGLTS